MLLPEQINELPVPAPARRLRSGEQYQYIQYMNSMRSG
jgi:hypothetical protein